LVVAANLIRFPALGQERQEEIIKKHAEIRGFPATKTTEVRR
jgi:hypothetical protein